MPRSPYIAEHTGLSWEFTICTRFFDILPRADVSMNTSIQLPTISDTTTTTTIGTITTTH